MTLVSTNVGDALVWDGDGYVPQAVQSYSPRVQRLYEPSAAYDDGALRWRETYSIPTTYQKIPARGWIDYLNLSADGSGTDKRLQGYRVDNPDQYAPTTHFYYSPWWQVGDDSVQYDYLNLKSRVSNNALLLGRVLTTLTVVGGQLTGVALVASTNHTGYGSGETYTMQFDSAPAATTNPVVTIGTRQNPPGSGLWDLDPTTITIVNAGSGIPSAAASYGYFPGDPGAAMDLAPEDHFVRENMSAAVAGTNLYHGIVFGPTHLSSGTLTNPFSTTANSNIVSVSHTAHGLITGNRIEFGRGSTVGGIRISGSFAVTVTNANSYTIVCERRAASTAGPGGGTVRFSAGNFAQYGIWGFNIINPADADPHARFTISTAAPYAQGGNRYLMTVDRVGFTNYSGVLKTLDKYSQASDDPVAGWAASQRNTSGWIGRYWASAYNSNGVEHVGAQMRAFAYDLTAGSEDVAWQWWTSVGGTNAARMTLLNGVLMAGAAGGDPGTGKLNTLGISVNGDPVVGARGAAVADATDLASAIAQLNTLLSRLRTHGLIAT